MINNMTIKSFFCTIYAVIIAIIYKTRTFMRWIITTSFCATLKRWIIASIHMFGGASFTGKTIPI